MKIRILFLVLISIIFLNSKFLISIGICQKLQIADGRKAAIGIEYLRPEIGGNLYTGMALFFSSEVKLSQTFFLQGEIPYAHGRSDYRAIFDGISSKDDALGNIFIGMKMNFDKPEYSASLGVYIPTTTPGGYIAKDVGALSDIGRYEAFARDWIMFKSDIGIQKLVKPRIIGSLNISPTYWYCTNNQAELPFSPYGNGKKLILHYNGQLWYWGQDVNFGAGISGITNLFEKSIIGRDKSLVQMEFGASFNVGQIKPGINFIFPLSYELDNRLQYVVGMNIQMQY